MSRTRSCEIVYDLPLETLVSSTVRLHSTRRASAISPGEMEPSASGNQKGQLVTSWLPKVKLDWNELKRNG